MMEHCTSIHGHGGLGPAILVTIPAAVPVEARALVPAVVPSALPVAPPAAAPAPSPKFRPNSIAIVLKCSPFAFYLGPNYGTVQIQLRRGTCGFLYENTVHISNSIVERYTFRAVLVFLGLFFLKY